jgi:hypothetical protein
LPFWAASQQVLDDLRVGRGAVQGHLDATHLGVIGSLAQETLHRGAERFVGVLEQDGAGSRMMWKMLRVSAERMVQRAKCGGIVQAGMIDGQLQKIALGHDPLDRTRPCASPMPNFRRQHARGAAVMPAPPQA